MARQYNDGAIDAYTVHVYVINVHTNFIRISRCSLNECLKVRENNCKNCYKCIRNCPVKAISFSSNQAAIVQDECILCGRCFVCCPQHAKVVRDDLPVASALIEGVAPVYASIAPSFAANYPGINFESMKEALLKLGFDGVEETAIGATLVKSYYKDMIENETQKVIISSCCHTVNMLIQRYYPEALPYLAKVQSPMLAHSAAIKREHEGAKTIFIGPCISKKDEADQYPGIVDCVLTFRDLSRWLFDEGIELHKESGSDKGGKARLFPVAGGIIRSMKAVNKKYRYLTIDGMERCIAALRDISEGHISDNCFIEMSACEGICIGGPAMSNAKVSPISGGLAIENRAGTGDYPIKMPKPELLIKSMPIQKVKTPLWDITELESALIRMGKCDPADELNCGSCGYESCREKAASTISGKTDEAMCMPYLMDRAQSFSDIIVTNSLSGVIVLSESLLIQEFNPSAISILGISNEKTLIGESIAALLDPEPFIEVLEECKNKQDLMVYLKQIKKHISLSVLYDVSYRVVIAVISDITEQVTAREIKEARDRRTIEITDKVIEKQMATVQVIASLLGETTAEAKIALTKLKETLHDE